jgi:hypothetical protein
MSAICDEARKFAQTCRVTGVINAADAAEIIEGLCDWADVQFSTIREQKIEIRSMRKTLGDKFHRLPGDRHTYEEG